MQYIKTWLKLICSKHLQEPRVLGERSSVVTMSLLVKYKLHCLATVIFFLSPYCSEYCFYSNFL